VNQDLGRLAGLGKDLGVIVQDYEKADYSRLNASVCPRFDGYPKR
jgi:hypothetical protein